MKPRVLAIDPFVGPEPGPRYGEHVAEIAIDALKLTDGWLPPRALRLVLEWAREHQGELRTVVWPNGFDLDPDVLHGRRSRDVPPAGTHRSAA